MKVAFFSTQVYDKRFFDKANTDYQHDLHYFEPALSWDTRSLAQGFPALCIFVNDKVDAELMQYLGKQGVQLLALRCAGFNQIDLEEAGEQGIKVLRVPAYSPHAVAEHAVALILTLNRKTHKAYNRVREQNFSLERLEGFDLYNKTVGVIGTGKIGKVFCEIMLGFGCKILATDMYPSKELISKGVNYTELDTLLNQSDIISLHCPLTPATHHIINQDRLSKMKDGVMLINTSRGALVNTPAVIEALRARKIGYLGIDVYEQEEKIFFRNLSETMIEDEDIMRLNSFPNVLITAHQAFFTENALTQIAETTLQNITDFESGIESPNQVLSDRIK